MKTKFSITIYKPSPVLYQFTEMIANHNGGKKTASLDLFRACADLKKYEYPNLCQNQECIQTGAILEVWDDGECAIMVEEREVYELADDGAATEAHGFGALADG